VRNNSTFPSQNLVLARGIQPLSDVDYSPTAEPLDQAQLADQFSCYRCGVVDVPRIAPGKGPHAYAAQCASCGAFIRWVSRYAPAERQARREQARRAAMAQRPPSPLQIAYLAAPGDADPPPANMAEASERIDAALQRGEVAS
jgi:hypothetical protein